MEPRSATGTERPEARGVPKAKAIARGKVITFPEAKALRKTSDERQKLFERREQAEG
jgi:hypothetical protein